MVELVDTLDLGSSAERCGGSSPSTRTNTNCLQLAPMQSKSYSILYPNQYYFYVVALVSLTKQKKYFLKYANNSSRR